MRCDLSCLNFQYWRCIQYTMLSMFPSIQSNPQEHSAHMKNAMNVLIMLRFRTGMTRQCRLSSAVRPATSCTHLCPTSDNVNPTEVMMCFEVLRTWQEPLHHKATKHDLDRHLCSPCTRDILHYNKPSPFCLRSE